MSLSLSNPALTGLSNSRREATSAAGGSRERFLRRPEVERMTGLSRSQIYKLMSEGRFPEAIPLSPRVVVWLASDVDAWIAARIAEHQRRKIR